MELENVAFGIYDTLYHHKRECMRDGVHNSHEFLMQWIETGSHPNLIGEPSFPDDAHRDSQSPDYMRTICRNVWIWNTGLACCRRRFVLSGPKNSGVSAYTAKAPVPKMICRESACLIAYCALKN